MIWIFAFSDDGEPRLLVWERPEMFVSWLASLAPEERTPLVAKLAEGYKPALCRGALLIEGVERKLIPVSQVTEWKIT